MSRFKLVTHVALLLVCLSAIAQSANSADTDDSGSLTPVQQALLQAHGPWPVSLPPDAGNELSGQAWAEALGRYLFNATQFSGTGTLSCATCHQAQAGFSDNLPVAIGAKTHVRNTQGLLDIALQRWFGWDGGADSLWAATLRPLLSDIEMDGDIPTIAQWLRQDSTFQDSVNLNASSSLSQFDDEALVVIAAKSIAAYTRTLRSPRTRFDVYRDAVVRQDTNAMQTYPAAAKRGLKLFLGDANCHVCHFGPNFSNGEFHDTGRPFFTAVGKVDPGRYTGIQRVRQDRYNLLGEFSRNTNEQQKRKVSSVKLGQSNWGEWRTPSLRNLTLTAPYMHDGSIATLRGVIDAYADIDLDRLHADGESILKPLALSDRQRNDMVEFLRTLSP